MRMNRAILVLAVAALPWRTATAQGATATVSGQVRDPEGHGISGPVIVDSAAKLRAFGDDSGYYSLPGLAPGPHRLIVRRIAYERGDTTITVTAGQNVALNVVLQPSDFLRQAMREDRARSESPTVDSVAGGLLHADTSGVLDFRTFGRRLLFAAIAAHGAAANTVLSPVSAGVVLSLAWTGARGATAGAMGGVLGLGGLDRTEVEARGAEFLRRMSGRTDVTLDVGNAVWVKPPFAPVPAFATTARSSFGARVAQLALDTPAAVDTINRWVSDATHGRIPRMLEKPLPREAAMYLVNAVYFRGKWLAAFDSARTRPRDFTLDDGRRVRVPMMDIEHAFLYGRFDGYRVLRIPYRTGRTAMYVVLPDPGELPAALEAHLLANGWPDAGRGLYTTAVHLVLPKLHAEQTQNLGPLLESLGMRPAFDKRQADFSGMMVNALRDSLYIAQVTQKVYLDVDEQGTEAAAATGLVMMVPTSVGPGPVQFVVDRPFLFLLRDELTGADLFAGWIAHP